MAAKCSRFVVASSCALLATWSSQTELGPAQMGASGQRSLSQTLTSRDEGDPEDIDALIDELPPVEYPTVWDEKAGKSKLNPAVERLRKGLGRSIVPTDEQWRRILIETGIIRWRETWPESHSFAIGLKTPPWLRNGEIRLTPKREGLEPATAHSHSPGCGTCNAWGCEGISFR